MLMIFPLSEIGGFFRINTDLQIETNSISYPADTLKRSLLQLTLVYLDSNNIFNFTKYNSITQKNKIQVQKICT